MKPIVSFRGKHGFLSNFYSARIWIEEHRIAFPSVEHAYQACKTPLDYPDRAAKLREFAALDSPGAAKRAGRNVPARKDWDRIRVPLMRRLLMIKFNPDIHLDLAVRLLDTKDRLIVEGNTWGDRFWGICEGTGQNHFGKLLMEVRQSVAVAISEIEPKEKAA